MPEPHRWICAGWCYLLQNNVIKAHEAYQKAMQIDSKSADGWGGIALVYALQNNLSEAKKALDTAERLDPECYLAAVARIMIANHASPERAAKAFNTTFPEVAVEMNRIIASHFIHLSKPYVPRTSWA